MGFFVYSTYENLAMRLLQCLYLSNPIMARLALKRENFEFNKLSLLEVASMLLNMKINIKKSFFSDVTE